MGQLERLKEERAKQKGNGRANVGKDGGLFTFRPTVAQRERLASYTADFNTNMLTISRWVDQGCTLNLGVSSKNNSYRLVLREPSEDWRDAQAVSVWHSDLEKVVQGLAFYLTEVNEDWPRVATPQLFSDDW